MSVARFEEERREMIAAIRMIAEHLVAETGKTALDDRVLTAMTKVPRHEFVPLEASYAYLNTPLPIGFDKTISQPLMVAVMTDLLDVKPDDVALEIGTGLGYFRTCQCGGAAYPPRDRSRGKSLSSLAFGICCCPPRSAVLAWLIRDLKAHRTTKCRRKPSEVETGL